ncbi:unnamed protein product [Adineta steineri]|uniref:Peptidoglycan binding-like domain-containing protein n=1 Tax=Adineta steineri TaxID=433720 RepID=A0A818XW00_9BILA|nr:unnamed protein product [Adineta steineri]CAF3746007.1 unnamed protein product [Adineta steineri]
MNNLFVLLIIVVNAVHSVPVELNNVLCYLKLHNYIQCNDTLCSNIILSETLQDFQHRNGLLVTGTLDDQTKALMGISCLRKVEIASLSEKTQIGKSRANKSGSIIDTETATISAVFDQSKQSFKKIISTQFINRLSAKRPKRQTFYDDYRDSSKETSSIFTHEFDPVADELTQATYESQYLPLVTSQSTVDLSESAQSTFEPRHSPLETSQSTTDHSETTQSTFESHHTSLETSQSTTDLSDTTQEYDDQDHDQNESATGETRLVLYSDTSM